MSIETELKEKQVNEKDILSASHVFLYIGATNTEGNWRLPLFEGLRKCFKEKKSFLHIYVSFLVPLLLLTLLILLVPLIFSLHFPLPFLLSLLFLYFLFSLFSPLLFFPICFSFLLFTLSRFIFYLRSFN